MLYKNMRRPAVEGLISVHGESRREFVSEDVSAEVVYLQSSLMLSSVFSLHKSFLLYAYGDK